MKATSSCYSCFCKSEEWSGVDVNELLKASEKANTNDSKVYALEDQSEHEIPNEVVLKSIGSMIYENLIDLDSRDGDKVDTGYPLIYFTEIVRYMKNEYDISEWNDVEFDGFCKELISLNIPFRTATLNRLCTNNNKGYRWKNRCLIVNGDEYKLMMNYIIIQLGDLQYNSEKDRYEAIIAL